MNPTPLQLLNRLEPPVRPAGPGRSAPPRPPLDRAAFGELMQLVSTGTASSGRPVRVELERDDLDDARRQRLAAAADLAESEGARRALLLLDGRALVLDVAERTVREELDAARPSPLVHLDAAVHVADPAASPTPPPDPRTVAALRGDLVPGSRQAPPFPTS